MGQKQPAKSEVIEQGDIYFIFRPKVEQNDPKGVQDVERFYMVLSPEGRKIYRMIVVGQKRPQIRGLRSSGLPGL